MCVRCEEADQCKTELVIFGASNDLDKISGWTVTVGDAEILPSESARNIGAFMDSSLNMRTHISKTIQFCYAQVNLIAQIRKYLSPDSAKTIVHAFVTS